MRPLVVSAALGIPALGPSGASAHLRGIAEALGAPIVCPERADRRGEAATCSQEIHAVGRAGWPTWAPRQALREVRTARRVAAKATELQPTLVWERHSLYSDAGWKLHAATGARWLLEVNAPLVDERLRYETVADLDYARSWEREVLLAAPEIVAVSRWLVGWLESLGCKHVRHLPNGVSAHVGDREGTRARLGLGDAQVVGFLGSMKPWHGAERIAAVLDALPNAIGITVGTGPARPGHPRLRHLGQLSEAEVANAVAAMDVALSPYRADSPPWFCPLKLLAYRAQGTPIVATDVGDTRELVGDGGVVLPVSATDAELVEAVANLGLSRRTVSLRNWNDVVADALGASWVARSG